jgi:hypothetical protein
MTMVNLICGLLLVFAGRSLFWLCVGIIGFLLGMQCAPQLGWVSGPMAPFAAVGLGCIGAVLAVAFEWFMVVFGIGFLGGGYLLMTVALPAAGQAPYPWLIFVVGGILGMCLMIIVFDWTLIIVSSLLGAMLIAGSLHSAADTRDLLFLGFAVVGIITQALALRGEDGYAPPRREVRV